MTRGAVGCPYPGAVRRSAAGAVALIAGGLACVGMSACGLVPGSAPASPPYGSEGPATVEELNACLAGQPEERRLVRSKVNGSLSADIRFVGSRVSTSPFVNTVLIENGMINGRPAGEEIAERMDLGANPPAFEAYRSGAFAVYPGPQAEAIREFQATVDACLPATSPDL